MATLVLIVTHSGTPDPKVRWGLTVGGSFSFTGRTTTVTGNGTLNPRSHVILNVGSTLTMNGNPTNNCGSSLTGYR